MKTRRHPAAAVPKGPTVKSKQPVVKLTRKHAGRKANIDKVNTTRKRASDEEDPSSVDERVEDLSSDDRGTEERRTTPTKRARLDSVDQNDPDMENDDEGQPEVPGTESDRSDVDDGGISRDVLQLQNLYGLKPIETAKKRERLIVLNRQKSKLSRLRTDKTGGGKLKLLIYQTLKDYLKGKSFRNLKPFYRESKGDAEVMMGLGERKPTELSLTNSQFKEVALMRLTDFTAEKTSTFVWNLICALHMRSVLEHESTKKWYAYRLEKDSPAAFDESLQASPTAPAKIKELVPKIIENLEATGVPDEELILQGTTKTREGTALAIGVISKSSKRSKKKEDDVLNVSTAVYVVDPRIPYIFYHGSKLNSEHLQVIMNTLDVNYHNYVKIHHSDIGLESVLTVCGAPPLSKAILDEMKEAATKKAEETAELKGFPEQPEMVASLKRKFLCSSLLSGPHGFNKTNHFKMDYVTPNKSKVVVEFSSKSGNVGKMISRMVAAGADPVPYLKALSKKSNSAEAALTLAEPPKK